MMGFTDLRFEVHPFIVAIRGGTERGSRASIAASNATPLGKVLLSLLFPDLNLLLFTSAAQFIGLEGVLGLEGGAPVFRDVSVGHDCCRAGIRL